MKYIRTKDGVYEYLGEDNLGWRRIRLEGKFIVAQDPKVEIICEADTIEELCDKFVWIDDEYRRGFIGNIEFAKNCTKSHVGKLYGDSKFIFGAIWTDKGLIYVAKLNDEGELELL